jgi:nucleoside phosphorylase
MRELAVISHDLVRDDIELIAYGNYPLWNLHPGVPQYLATASPEDALKMGADFISISAPVTISRTITDPAGLVIEACLEFSRYFQE